MGRRERRHVSPANFWTAATNDPGCSYGSGGGCGPPQVDVILAAESDTIRASWQATKKIPIVMTASGDPVGSGVVASLARPGGNVTD